MHAQNSTELSSRRRLKDCRRIVREDNGRVVLQVLSGANGLVVLPPKASVSQAELKAGDHADAILIGELQPK